MSKSIYEEALEILKERSEIERLIAKIKKVKDVIEQAQKQEKLLDLYKELATVREDLLYCHRAVDFIPYKTLEKKEIQLENEIKELENDK